MHRSRLTQILIDCPESTMKRGVEFWTQALGLEVDPDDPQSDERYKSLGKVGDARVLLQSVKDQSAYHLDIETDDVEAEVARLEKLGATRKAKRQTWWVMQAPTGHTFCVIRPQSDDFPGDDARTWK